MFFDDPQTAKGAGFRACKRCKPEERSTRSYGDGSLEPGEQNARRRTAAKAKDVIVRGGGMMSWKDVAEEVGLSPRYLFDAFKAAEGVTPGVFAQRVKQWNVDSALTLGAATGANDSNAVPSMPHTPVDAAVPDSTHFLNLDPILGSFAFSNESFNLLADNAWAYPQDWSSDTGCQQLSYQPAEIDWDELFGLHPVDPILEPT